MHYSGGILSRATRRLSHDCISSLYHLHFTCISSYHPLLVCIYSYRPLFIHMSNEANEEHDVQQNCKTAKLQNFTSFSSPSISSSHHPHITQKSSQYHSNILIIWCILESPPCLDIIIIPVVLYHPHIMGGLSWAGHRCTTASTIEPCFHASKPHSPCSRELSTTQLHNASLFTGWFAFSLENGHSHPKSEHAGSTGP